MILEHQKQSGKLMSTSENITTIRGSIFKQV